MTERAVFGLAALNAAYLCAGVAVLWALRGFHTWASLLRLAGLSYLLGVAVFGILWTELLVIGVPFGGAGLAFTLGRIDAYVEGKVQNVYSDQGLIDTKSIRVIPVSFGIVF